MKATKDKLAALRAELKNRNLDGWIVPHSDEYLSEYLPESAERLAWLTGFTGSSGYAIILADRAVVMTHGIYTIQIRKEVDASVYEIDDFTQTPLGIWIAEAAKEGARIGYDPRLHTRTQIEPIAAKAAEKNIILQAVKENPVDAIWSDRPAAPKGQVSLFPDRIAGRTSAEKRTTIAAQLKEEKLSSLVVTQSDSICWLLNVRGEDIPYNPLVLSNLILHADSTADWYVDPDKLADEVKSGLGPDIRIHAPENFDEDLKKLKGPVQIDPNRSPMEAGNILKEAGIETHDAKDPCVLPKAIKTLSEQRAMKQAHVRDGIAVSRFLHWLDCQDFSKTRHTELSCAEKLEEFRKGHESYRGPSFATISGWADHGAIIHYRVTPETDQEITGNNLYLLDSGGQYEYGTTDITRTIVIGDIDDETRNAFTRVLKGHIAVASAVMDETMDGAALDKLARVPLLEDGKDYAHGTGHGVGCMLAVHEEAVYVAPKSVGAFFKPGMIVSNEPGYYLENHFGIRHENLMLCHENEADGTLYWETITVVPFDLRGVNWDLITEREKEWLENYHRHVYETLSPFLQSIELDWLRDVCFSYFRSEE